MKLKRKLSVTLVVLLILLRGFPAFATVADELHKQTKTDITNDIGTPSQLPDNPDKPFDPLPDYRQIAEEIASPSNDGMWLLPDTPPEFSAKIEYTTDGYVLKGTFTDFLPNTCRVRPMYSLDGEIFEPVGGEQGFMDWDLSRLGINDPEEQVLLQNQICAYATDEPMESYLEQRQERFYIRLQITTLTGDTYDTETVVVERGTPQLPPENARVSASFTASMIAVDRSQRPPYTYGKYQITVKESVTSEDVEALLPDTLPLEVRIEQPDTGEIITSGIAECEVAWNELSELTLTAGEALIIPDAAKELMVPAGTMVSTPLGIYVLSEAVAVEGAYARDEIRIVVNVIGANEEPDISLTGNTKDDFVNGFEPLSLAFRLKPTGAVSIRAYSYVEGDEKWTEIGDLLSLRDVNANQSEALYGYVDVLQSDESPYKEYLEGKIPGILIGVTIEGGTFHGEQVILPWPGEYTLPPRIPELVGSGGNEGNAGSGDGSGDSTEEGQRPGLPGMPADRPEHEENTASQTAPVASDTVPPTGEPGNEMMQLLDQPPVSPEYLTERPPVTGEDSTVAEQTEAVQTKADNRETIADTPTEPEADNAEEISAWDEIKAQEETQEKPVPQTATRQNSNTEQSGGLPVVVAVLLLGGGIAAVAVAGARSGEAKWFVAFRKFLMRLLHQR